jgi:flagellar hook assembly protein FlgD
VKRLAAGLTAGPTAALKQSGGVFFFRRGPRVESAALCVYDALGNAVAKIAINDDAAVGDSDGRVVGLWDLKDAKGHPAPTGTYLVKGAVAAGGKRERVSALVVVK